MSPSCGRINISSMTVDALMIEAENIVLATSSAGINLESGKLTPSQAGVKVAPGRTAVTLIPCVFNSSLNTLVNPNKANLLMQ